MRPCFSPSAFAQMSCTPSSLSASTVSTLASMSPPMPTTACANSCTPRRRRVPPSVVSAWTTWVRRSAQDCTSSASTSMPSTSCPRRTSDSATAPPNRPRPITATLSLRGEGFLANDGALLRIAERPPPGLQREAGRDGHGADPAEEHQRHEEGVAGGGQAGGDAGGQPDGGEGRDDLEQRVVEFDLADGQEEQSRGRHEADGQQDDRQRLTLRLPGDAPAERGDVRLPADLRPDHGAEREEGRHLDAPRRARAAAPYHHQGTADRQAFRPHLPDVQRVEPRRPSLDGVERGAEQLAAPIEGPEGRRVAPFVGEERGRPAEQEQAGAEQGELGVQRPPRRPARVPAHVVEDREADPAQDHGGHERAEDERVSAKPTTLSE